MTKTVSYSEARANLAKIWDDIISNREIAVLTRRGKDDIALIPADELAGLLESIHVLRSPKNASRLLSTLEKAKANEGTPSSIAQLKEELLGDSQ